MREARQAVAAMRASVATNSATSAHFFDRVEKRHWRAPDVCDHHVRSRVMEPGPQPRSTGHACRAYDVSDGLLDSTARPCRGGGGEDTSHCGCRSTVTFLPVANRRGPAA